MSSHNPNQPAQSSMPPPQPASPVACSPQTSSPMGPPQAHSPMGHPPSLSPGVPPVPAGPSMLNIPHGPHPNMQHPYNSTSAWQNVPGGYPMTNNYMTTHPSPGTSPGPAIGVPHSLPGSQQSHSVSGSTGNSYSTNAPPTSLSSEGSHENFRDIHKAITSMEESGLTKDPRYNELVSMRAKFSSSYSDSIDSSSQDNHRSSGILSPSHMYQLRAQVMAYRYIFRNQPVPSHISMIAQGKRFDSDPNRANINQNLPNAPYMRHPTPTGRYRCI